MNNLDWMSAIPTGKEPPMDRLYFHRGHQIASNGYVAVMVATEKQTAPDLPKAQAYFDGCLNLPVNDALPRFWVASHLYQFLVRAYLAQKSASYASVEVGIDGVVLDAKLLLLGFNHLPLTTVQFWAKGGRSNPNDWDSACFVAPTWRLSIAPIRRSGSVPEYAPLKVQHV